MNGPMNGPNERTNEWTHGPNEAGCDAWNTSTLMDGEDEAQNARRRKLMEERVDPVYGAGSFVRSFHVSLVHSLNL